MTTRTNKSAGRTTLRTWRERTLWLAALAVVGAAATLVATADPVSAPAASPLPSHEVSPAAARPGPGAKDKDTKDAAPVDGVASPSAPVAKGGGMHMKGTGVRSHPATQGTQPAPSWDEAAAFMKALSPRKFVRFEQLPDRPVKQDLRNGIVARYREFRDLKAEDPARYELMAEQARIEDGIFGAVDDFRTTTSDGQKEKARQEMREWVRKLRANRRQFAELDLARAQKRQAALQQELDGLGKRIAALTTQIDRTKTENEDSINRRAEFLLQNKFGSGGERHGPGKHRPGTGESPNGGSEGEAAE